MGKRPTIPPAPLQAFMREVTQLGHHHQPWRIFSDFCELSEIALRRFPFPDPTREDRFRKVVSAYEPDEAAAFPRMLAHVVDGLELEPCDFLGDAFQRLELSNHWCGQFFTPVAIARLCAELQIGPALSAEPFATVSDPACGAGVQLLAFAQAMRAHGINPQQRLYAVGQDVDPTAARMCFVQLSLSGIPAAVVIGNTLALEQRDVMRTLWHHLGFWDAKLARRRAADTSPPAGAEASPEADSPDTAAA